MLMLLEELGLVNALLELFEYYSTYLASYTASQQQQSRTIGQVSPKGGSSQSLSRVNSQPSQLGQLKSTRSNNSLVGLSQLPRLPSVKSDGAMETSVGANLGLATIGNPLIRVPSGLTGSTAMSLSVSGTAVAGAAVVAEEPIEAIWTRQYAILTLSNYVTASEASTKAITNHDALTRYLINNSTLIYGTGAAAAMADASTGGGDSELESSAVRLPLYQGNGMKLVEAIDEILRVKAEQDSV